MKKQQAKKPIVKTPATVKKTETGFMAIERFFGKHHKLLAGIAFALGAIFTVLMFDIKISEGNDDSMYIEAGYRYAQDFFGYYYHANAPLYPMVLGVMTKIFGINLVLFKILNSVFFLLSLWVFYIAFSNRIPYSVLLPVLLMMSVNSYLLYYASQTYNEALFLLIQAGFYYVFFRCYDRIIAAPDIKISWKYWWAIGGMLFLMTFCKNIAIGAIGALMLFFIIEKRYVFIAWLCLGYAAVRLPFEAIKAAIWGSSNQYGSQGAILLQKDAYNPSLGNEDIGGFINRFFENFNLYISKRMFQVLGFRSDAVNDTHAGLTLLVIALAVFAGWWIWRTKQKAILLSLLYTMVLMGVTFIVLQVKWDQPRLIMVYIPFVVMSVFYGFYAFFQKRGAAGLILYPLLILLVTGSSMISTIKKSSGKIPVLKKNIAGDRYYGYTPDWENYLRLSEWCADSLPPGSLVACRKAPMSFVYGKGMEFFPVYTVIAPDSTTNLSNPDSVLNYFKENKVTHVILASLRRNPKKSDGYIINTLHRMLEPVNRKYAGKIRLVKQMGEFEPAYLYDVKELYNGN